MLIHFNFFQTFFQKKKKLSGARKSFLLKKIFFYFTICLKQQRTCLPPTLKSNGSNTISAFLSILLGFGLMVMGCDWNEPKSPSKSKLSPSVLPDSCTLRLAFSLLSEKLISSRLTFSCGGGCDFTLLPLILRRSASMSFGWLAGCRESDRFNRSISDSRFRSGGGDS